MASKKRSFTIEGHDLELSNLDKVLFPAAPFTKGQVIDYYVRAAEYLLPHLANRPVTLKRFPDGVNGEVFYEKNAPAYTPKWVKTFKVKRDSGGTINYILINDLATLIYTVNLANLEMHVFLAKTRALDTPTSMVFDLDPGEGMNVLDCGRLALQLKGVFDSLGLSSYPKVSGSKGMQVYVPLNTAVTFDSTSPFAKTLAQEFERHVPELVVSSMSKARRTGKIFIDWSQNSEKKTTVAVYSLRAKVDRPYISLPFDWREIQKAVSSGQPETLYLEPEEALARMQRKGDLFQPLLDEKQRLTKKVIDALPEAVAKVAAPRTARVASKPVEKSAKKLAEYNRKRDFSVTPEPGPRVGKRGQEKSRLFVIQKHQASHLHFDFRLEMNGVLRSWAVPKGPPLDPSEKRLAMLVEDHPLDYADFEGIIPKGNYGGGTVMVWDTGTYDCEEGSPQAAFGKGAIKLLLHGAKLQGGWFLVKDKRDERRWLMIMEKSGKVAVGKRKLERSVLSGRTLDEIAAAGDKVWGSGATKKKGRRK